MGKTNRELLEQIAEQVGVVIVDFADLKTDVAVLKGDMAAVKKDVAVLKTDVAELKTDVAELKTDVAELKTDVADLKKTTAKIELTLENEIKPKIEVLFDGHFQNPERLGRVEMEVAKHEEVILRKVR